MTVAAEKKPASLNKFEKLKADKDGLEVKKELDNFAKIGWEEIDKTDRDHRLKWLGVFFRPVTPGKFMLRLRMPSGIISSEQMRLLGEIIQRYGDDGSGDITTRQNIQLRGIRIEDVPDIFRRLQEVGMTSVQSGMDNVRNITGSPIAGLDATELIDTRELVQKVQDMITNNGEGNPEFTNLPRKFNIAIEGGRDNSVHAEINDIAFVPAYKDGTLGFNVVVGGFFSAKRCAAAIPLNAWVPPNDDVVDLCRAILTVYRDRGLRANRQKSRLMWLIDELGLNLFRAEVEKEFGRELITAAPKDEIDWEKRDHIGVHRQQDEDSNNLNYVGLHVPMGRFYADDMLELARLAEVYGKEEIRLTVEQNAIIPHIPDSRLEAFLQEPLLEKFSIAPAPLTRSLISCTGAQFCNFALIETKNRALAIAKELEAEVEMTQPVRIHWTGCPNSCGQPQVADIGLMGTKARKNGKAVEGVDIYMGGKVGKDAKLGDRVQKGIPCEDLKPVLRELLIEQFGARLKEGVAPIATDFISSNGSLNGSANGSLNGSANGNKAPSANGHSPQPKTATVVFAKSGKQAIANESEFILDIAEREGLELDSSCRSGTCGTCKQKLVSGEVTYDEIPAANSELEPGYILTCSAHPLGRVEIDA